MSAESLALIVLPSLVSHLADLVHLLLPVIDEVHALLQAAQILQAVLTGILLQETQQVT